jgi:hypothetical protein
MSVLDKLKESRGQSSLKELSDYVVNRVRALSASLKLKGQFPQTLVGSSLNKDLPILKL